MTNVPTLGGLLFFVAILSFIPFFTAFMISYAFCKKIKIGIPAGFLGIILFIITNYVLPSSNFLVSGLIGGIAGGAIAVALLSRPSSMVLKFPELKHSSIITIAITLVLLLSASLYYSSAKTELEFSIEDPYGDITYSGYSEPSLSGFGEIDIIGMNSQIIGENLVIEMDLAKEIPEDSTAEYTFMISTEKHNLWTDRIDLEEMEVEGSTLRAQIPLESLEDRKIFQVTAITSKYDSSVDLNRSDSCSNRGTIWEILIMLNS